MNAVDMAEREEQFAYLLGLAREGRGWAGEVRRRARELEADPIHEGLTARIEEAMKDGGSTAERAGAAQKEPA